jgi:dUTPase
MADQLLKLCHARSGFGFEGMFDEPLTWRQTLAALIATNPSSIYLSIQFRSKLFWPRSGLGHKHGVVLAI